VVKQFKLEMGIGDSSGSASEPELDISDQEAESGAKTIGKQRSQN